MGIDEYVQQLFLDLAALYIVFFSRLSTLSPLVGFVGLGFWGLSSFILSFFLLTEGNSGSITTTPTILSFYLFLFLLTEGNSGSISTTPTTINPFSYTYVTNIDGTP